MGENITTKHIANLMMAITFVIVILFSNVYFSVNFGHSHDDFSVDLDHGYNEFSAEVGHSHNNLKFRNLKIQETDKFCSESNCKICLNLSIIDKFFKNINKNLLIIASVATLAIVLFITFKIIVEQVYQYFSLVKEKVRLDY